MDQSRHVKLIITTLKIESDDQSVCRRQPLSKVFNKETILNKEGEHRHNSRWKKKEG